MREAILVTDCVFAKGEAVFRAAEGYDVETVSPHEDHLAERVLARRSRAVIVGVESYRGPLYEALGCVGGSLGAIIAREILQLIAEGETNKETATLIHLSVNTVDGHRTRIWTSSICTATANSFGLRCATAL